MGHSSCCVVNCKNTGKNSVCKFYTFPKAAWKLEQRKKWIVAVKRKNVDGSPWSPKPYDTICSAHFIGGKKSDEQANPSYVPTIFPSTYWKRKIDESQIVARYKRSMVRRNKKNSQTIPNETMTEKVTIKVNPAQIDMVEKGPSQVTIKVNPALFMVDQGLSQISTMNQGCQIDMYSTSEPRQTTFTCNRYIYSDHCDAEIQVEIPKSLKIVFTSNSPKQKDKSSGTPKIKYVDQSITTTSHYFVGISSVQNDQQLIDLAGISFKNFEFLLKKVSSEKCSVSDKDRLLIFLMKMKTGLTFTGLSVLFGVHRTTVSRIFYSILKDLVSTTANMVFWPDKATVQATMPGCFHPTFSDTRVIIDCTEFRIEIPAAADDHDVYYSHYKKGFTAKVVIGVTPGGFISFKSKVAGGRKTDSQMTVESGLIDQLETGDVVVADKGFAEIKKVLDESGKEVKIIMPPFLKNKTTFSNEETQKTNDVARVRIHIKRIMQRLRVYRVLDKIPHNLFHCIDDIVHVCCVLVNVQHPIFSIIKQEIKQESCS